MQNRNGLLPEVEPVVVIKFMMKQRGLTLENIAPYLGGQEMSCQIMSGKKSLTPKMIRALSALLHISAEALI